VRWGRFECATYRLQYTVEIIENLIIPKSDDTITVTRECGITPIVGFLLLSMLAAIEFDNQFASGAGEIGDKLPDRMLAPKLPRGDVFPQSAPENSFDVGSLPAQAPRDRRSRFQMHGDPHLAPPLRPIGAERGKRRGEGYTTNCVNLISSYATP
jgi:hypothetical protein